MRNKEKLEKDIVKFVKSNCLNRIASAGSDFLVLATMVGPLYIERVEAGKGYCNIFMRFEYPDRAVRRVDCNSDDGVWNIYGKTLFDAENQFVYKMNRLLNLR